MATVDEGPWDIAPHAYGRTAIWNPRGSVHETLQSGLREVDGLQRTARKGSWMGALQGDTIHGDLIMLEGELIVAWELAAHFRTVRVAHRHLLSLRAHFKRPIAALEDQGEPLLYSHLVRLVSAFETLERAVLARFPRNAPLDISGRLVPLNGSHRSHLAFAFPFRDAGASWRAPSLPLPCISHQPLGQREHATKQALCGHERAFFLWSKT